MNIKIPDNVQFHDQNRSNQSRYEITSIFYDFLDRPWEKIYSKWRPEIVGDLRGEVLEAGVGTGRNLPHYHQSVRLTAIDICEPMLHRASRRAQDASCYIEFLHEDACLLNSIEDNSFDTIVATFLCCVIPPELQTTVLNQFARVLKPGGKFRTIEMITSKIPSVRLRQKIFAPFVKTVYGAGFDRNTHIHIEESEKFRIDKSYFLKQDVYLFIECTKL